MPSPRPFLFFNGNTFTDVGRQLAAALFADLPTGRRRNVRLGEQLNFCVECSS